MGDELYEEMPDGVSASKRDVGPMSDELKRELREGARELGAVAAAGAFGLLAAEIAILAATDLLARRMQRSSAKLIVSGALAVGAIGAGAYAWREKQSLPGRRLLQRIFGA